MGYKIAIIGVGGAGTTTIKRMKAMLTIDSVIIDTEDNGIIADENILLSQNIESVDNFEISNTELTKLNAAISNYDIMILCAGLGGKTATAIAPIVSKLANAQNKMVISILYKPFMFEGNLRNKIAEKSASQIAETSDFSAVVSNDMISKTSPKNHSLSQAYSRGDELIFKIIEIITTEADNNNFEIAKNIIISKIEEAISKSEFIIK